MKRMEDIIDEWEEIQSKPIRWFENSIFSYVLDYLEKNEKTLSSNNKLIFCEQKTKAFFKARDAAFDLKYGCFDYNKDLRIKYCDDWYKVILSYIKEYMRKIEKNGTTQCIAVGANCGTEISEIFASLDRQEFLFELFDISRKALERGRRKFLPDDNVFFHYGDMEDISCESDEYDIYLNLRAITSWGVNIDKTLYEARRVLKQKGLIVVSIPNGYLDEFGNTVKGMWDNSRACFDENIPFVIAEKVLQKMKSCGFDKLNVEEGKTEIFIIGER